MTRLERGAARVAALPLWRGRVAPTPLAGGMTNLNFLVVDRGERFVVRLGEDIPVHGVVRAHELAAARAAHAAGLAPEVVYAEPGATVTRFVEGRTLRAGDLRAPETLARAVRLVRVCHREVARHLGGASFAFEPFAVLRRYAATLAGGPSRLAAALPRFRALIAALEAEAGTDAAVFCHNDLIAANFIDDGDRLWLIDWEYAGFSVPLMDLAGLAANSEYPPEAEALLLAAYFGAPADAALRRRFRAFKRTALLRETMWSLTAELHSDLDFDFAGYTDAKLRELERALAEPAA